MKNSFKLFSMAGLCVLGLGSAAGAGSFVINDCKLDIESVVVRPITHVETLHFYLRTQTGFGSAVTGVSLVGEQIYLDDEGHTISTEINGGKGFALNNVPGYQSLWETDVVVSADNDVGGIYNTRVTANFVVTTVAGDTFTLWGKDPQSGAAAKFTFDPNMYQNLEAKIESLHLPYAISDTPSSVNAMAVHGNFPYLDPNNCPVPSGVAGAPK